MNTQQLNTKWPNVPACFGWLSLDRRGNWRLQGERVTHAGLIELMNRHYTHDESGRWLVQNGPQQVFVDLAVTPWIFRLVGHSLFAHTGAPSGRVNALYLDSEGNLLIDAEIGIGLLDDRDLAAFFSACTDADNQTATDEALALLLEGQSPPVFWSGIPLTAITAVNLGKRFNFVQVPENPE